MLREKLRFCLLRRVIQRRIQLRRIRCHACRNRHRITHSAGAAQKQFAAFLRVDRSYVGTVRQ